MRWNNNDQLAHTVTNGRNGTAVGDPAFDEPLPAGGSVEVTFDEPGQFDVTCTIHPLMQMLVVVEG